MRFLAIDIGEKRTGLAVGSDVTGMAGPAGTISTSSPEERLRLIGKAVEEHGPDELVIGIPLNMDGTEGKPAKKIRELAATLTKQYGLKVNVVDERLTTFAADEMMSQSGRTRGEKKAVRDALAATTILEDFLRTRKQVNS